MLTVPNKTYKAGLLIDLAQKLVNRNVSPYSISLLSVFFTQLSLIGLLLSWHFALIFVIMGIIMCIVCTKLTYAMETVIGFQSVRSPLFKEIINRITDIMFFVFIGYFANYPALGWAAALMSAISAYIRVLGFALTGEYCTKGPMANKHRMATLIITLAIAQIMTYINPKLTDMILQVGLMLCALGALATCINRYVHINISLRGVEKSSQDEL